MNVKVVMWTFLVLLAVVPLLAQQTKTVTNSDLEKYREKRLRAERDYNENYARMGFPSPDELQKQIEKSRVEREALSARLTSERIQQEQADAARAAAASRPERNVYVVSAVPVIGGYIYSYPSPYSYWRRPRPAYPYWYPTSVGNGIPIVNSNPTPTIRQVPKPFLFPSR